MVFTACYSRHCFVWLSLQQTTQAVIDGCEAAWAFFGGIFATVIPDSLSAVVDTADPLGPRLNQAFVEYAQARGFRVDPARVRRPQDKPRVERMCRSCATHSSPASASSIWPTPNATPSSGAGSGPGNGSTAPPSAARSRCSTTEELPRLAPPPAGRYDLPIYATAKVHRDHHVEVAKALYSVPGNLIGTRVEVRADR